MAHCLPSAGAKSVDLDLMASVIDALQAFLVGWRASAHDSAHDPAVLTAPS